MVDLPYIDALIAIGRIAANGQWQSAANNCTWLQRGLNLSQTASLRSLLAVATCASEYVPSLAAGPNPACENIFARGEPRDGRESSGLPTTCPRELQPVPKPHDAQQAGAIRGSQSWLQEPAAFMPAGF